ncbi:MAG: esterase [Dysgonamonadaceae bacterium]|jgi:enterochelin esterase family protein|nr:esterase [Dysgonamonadaceae bacterium]
MKKTAIPAILLLTGTAIFAQQALWGGQEVVSPEIHNDYRVSFRLNAPHALKIELTGDFFPAGEQQDSQGTVEMTKNAQGVWEYTTPEPLPSELYSYSFRIDGVKVTDPANVHQIRDVASVTSTFLIGGGQADLYKVNAVPHGAVTRCWYDSPGLEMNRRLTVYTPPGYESGGAEYPVFYLLHGAGGDEEAWIALGRTSQILDNLIALGRAQPMIVVMANCNAGQEAAPGESSEGLVRPSFAGTTLMDGRFEAAFPDIIRFIESNYRVKKDKACRAIAGLSMGGFRSMHISKQYPDLFDYVGLFSAVIEPRGEVTSEVFQNTGEKLKVQFAKKPKCYYIAIGNTDFLYQANVDFRRKLDENQYPYLYCETGEGHIWKNWRIYLTKFVPMLFQ